MLTVFYSSTRHTWTIHTPNDILYYDYNNRFNKNKKYYKNCNLQIRCTNGCQLSLLGDFIRLQ